MILPTSYMTPELEFPKTAAATVGKTAQAGSGPMFTLVGSLQPPFSAWRAMEPECVKKRLLQSIRGELLHLDFKNDSSLADS